MITKTIKGILIFAFIVVLMIVLFSMAEAKSQTCIGKDINGKKHIYMYDASSWAAIYDMYIYRMDNNVIRKTCK